ncbi:MAG: 2,3-bisphosphoglycerate-independent phosphoglycerate mutase [bacterium]|nr:2,3-bisphosphoglycerate-independent phosphoglycerate mutase [bacterium]
MEKLKILKELTTKTPSKIILIISDGLGGHYHPQFNATELEYSQHRNLDELAKNSLCGVADPVYLGITPGSGPGHLAIFGYDPINNLIGRGFLDACGVLEELPKNALYARGNFCTIKNNLVVDRRAGRIDTAYSKKLIEKIGEFNIDYYKIRLIPTKEYRFVFIVEGEDLSDQVTETDPLVLNAPPLEVKPLTPQATKTAQICNKAISIINQKIKYDEKANGILLRGFSKYVDLPPFSSFTNLTPLCIAIYPMYRGLARIMGMDVIKAEGDLEDEIKTLKENYEKYDFVFLHFKKTDSSGEDGDFLRKCEAIEKLDKAIPEIVKLNFDVIAVTGDHSTPSVLKSHSWHPVPFLIYSKLVPNKGPQRFTEFECFHSGIGRINFSEFLPLLLANALKLKKFGA